MDTCVFCRIVSKQIQTTSLYEDDLVMAFPDLHPIAPVHILVIPKEHIESIAHLTEDEKHERIAGRMIIVAKRLAEEKGISQSGYKLLFRTGRHGGQEIPHIHLHLLGGARLSEGIGPI